MTDVRRRAAGWYDDEADAAVLRYWDGAKWTPHTTPRPDDEPAEPAAPVAVAAAVAAAPPTAQTPMPVPTPSPLPAQMSIPLPSPLPLPLPLPVTMTTLPGPPTMTSSSPEFVSDTLRAPSFSAPPVLHAPNEHTTVPLPEGRAAASAQATSARASDAATPGDRSFLLTWLFALMLGSLGVDRFYLGRIGTAVAKLVTLGGFGVWTLIDLVLVLTGAQRDRDGHALSGYDEHRRLAWIVSGALVAFGVLAAIGTSVVIASLTANLGAVGGLG